MLKQAVQLTDALKGKKVLVMGLGLHGGGRAVVRWLVSRGAKVTATDLRERVTLAPSLRALKGLSVSFVLGRHRMEDFRSHDVVVVGPGVPRESPYLLAAMRAGKTIENDASLFFRYLKNSAIAVTGTRGKTTTTLWVAELLRKKYPLVRQSGTPENAELEELERINGKNVPAVVELSSLQLEYLPKSGKTPHIAAITNIYPEHLNRYRDIKHYATAKANIFLGQHREDILVLNHDNPWHRFFLKKRPRGVLYYISTKVLPKKLDGAYVKSGKLILRIGGKETPLFSVVRFKEERGSHNLENLLRAVLIARLYDPQLPMTERDLLRLPTPRMRQETIYREGRLTVVNDSCATSPDGTIAAIRRFADGNTRSDDKSRVRGRTLRMTPQGPTSYTRGKSRSVVLITGGTDKELEFDGLAAEIKRHIPKRQLVLLEGSATTKLVAALRKRKYFSAYEPLEFLDLAVCVKEAFRIAADSTRSDLKNQSSRSDLVRSRTQGRSSVSVVVLFSPGAASFEKFLHEFDRGEQFNKLIKNSQMKMPPSRWH